MPSTDPAPNPTKPADPEEEEIDQQCAFEFGLPLPTYDGPIGRPTSTVEIPPPPPPPSPSPQSNLSPPSPNPATESLHCYNSGAMTGRRDALKALNKFCYNYAGVVLDATRPNTRHTLQGDYLADCLPLVGCFVLIHVSVTVTNGCRFAMDGPDPAEQCGRILRETIVRCDTASTRFKQGGSVTSNCAIWTFDPNLNNVDLLGIGDL
ncbi:MAG: hypothetical protein M1816_006867 [Peltula sp. TS41687]|nr:MAG: hypothetical protein M1816_006867 [Peltula sp. TS41687]